MWSMTSSETPLDFTGAGGIRIAADVAGDPRDPPVVFLHGGGQTRHSWRGTARIVADRGWRTYTVDLRGHGESAWSEAGEYGLDDFGADVEAILDDIGRPAALVGASLGGLASLLALGEHPERQALALVLVDVAPHVEQAGAARISAFMETNMERGFASLEEVADAISAYNPHRPRPADLSGLRKNVRQRADGRWVWHWDPRFQTQPRKENVDGHMSMVPPDRLDAAAIALRVPVLLIRGRVSDLLSEQGARDFLEIVPSAEFVDVEGAGHMVAGDRNDHFNAAILDFLDRQRPS
jgi:pimeloyl-ACP methyl ester carboxylesterase